MKHRRAPPGAETARQLREAMGYRVVVCEGGARQVRDGVPAGDTLTVERLYIKEAGKGPASSIAAMLAPPAPLLKGAPTTALGIGKEGGTGCAQRPVPGEPYTCGEPRSSS